MDEVDGMAGNEDRGGIQGNVLSLLSSLAYSWTKRCLLLLLLVLK